jgi:hypothetical protein
MILFAGLSAAGAFPAGIGTAQAAPEPAASEKMVEVLDDIAFFGGIKDRSTGTPGSEQAADYILKSFEEAGIEKVGAQKFLTPVPEVTSASLQVEGRNIPLHPWGPNLAYLSMTPREGTIGPLIYVENGNFDRFDKKLVRGSIVLMDMTSYSNWMNAAMFGAGAVIFLGDSQSVNGEFKEKNTTTPLALPRFWVSPDEGQKLKQIAMDRAPEAIVKSEVRWQNKLVRNCYGLLPGKDPKLKGELIVLDAFYDASSHILGLAPGADESTSIATMLSIARKMAQNPPDRSVLFLATAGNGQSLAGMRQFIWATTSRKKLIRKETKLLQEQKQDVSHQIELLDGLDPLNAPSTEDRLLIWQIVQERAKDKADALTRETQYRKTLSPDSPAAGDSAAELEDPRPYRRLSYLSGAADLTTEQKTLAMKLLQDARPDLNAAYKELQLRYEAVKSSNGMRNLMDDYIPVLFMSLYLSSHSASIGVVEIGETYPIRESIKRTVRAARLVEFLGHAGVETARETGLPNLIRNLSRGGLSEEGVGKSRVSSPLCCDVGVLAGLPAVSLMTPDDNRSLWSTPQDTVDRVDTRNVEALSRFLPSVLSRLFSYPLLQHASEGSIPALASLEGRAMFIRQGELFPDQPAPGTIISVIQGNSIFRSMVHRDGTFFIPGLANKRAALEKLILEPYGLDPDTGRVAWTADKAQTRKENYRIKVKSDLATTSLVMFHCEQTDVIGVFNPQDMGYLTRVELLDAVTEATPLRYWYSRVDGRNTMAVSVLLEKGSRFKLIMAESLLRKQLLLLNSSADRETGKGFLIGNPPTLPLVPRQVVSDLYLLVGGRLKNLFQHGIVNRHLESLYLASGHELEESRNALASARYGDFWKNIVSAWARLDIVYSEIENNQRDVLTGVMFFIALFVPFAFCMERYLFGFRGIYKQIAAFLLILIITILAIRALHPAFQLTYSPMVVIIAFFIVGLSLLVSMILFMRFEQEMAELHSRAAHIKTPQAGKWQAFGAGFSIGVSNLNRRKLRTGLTCLTLIILTFTVMSFTNVKSLHKTTRTRLGDETPYQGILLRHQYRLPLTLLTLEDMRTRFGSDGGSVWPRAWIEPRGSGAQYALATIGSGRGLASVEGILGLGEHPPIHFQAMLKHGRWFEPGEEGAILLPEAMAGQLGLDPEKDIDVTVSLMGDSFRVVGWFDEKRLDALKDLDHLPITPAYLEVSQNEELSEVEMEAIQSGEVLLPQTERFRYANTHSTVVLPFGKCISYGGVLKAVSILPGPGQSALRVADELSSWLAFPLFVGEEGTWYHSAGNTLRYQGAANLIVPILIVIFITLNTMIGHVHERQKEISTYTSVGLAPTHVGFLFIVEALSMAVISTVIGYILAQLSAKYLGNTALFSQLTFNYSSLASVACMFLVFSVVFLAALYPARVAAEIAMPDVNRSWTLPEPEGDVLYLHLPFLLKHEEEQGIMGFLNSFYTSHRDVAHGSFIVDETSLDVGTPEATAGEMPLAVCLLIRTNVWLAPFDFGIKQRLQLHCCPSVDNPGYLEIALQMIRISGERSAWVRANRNFIKALRKQMLLWRFLDREAKERMSAEFQKIS